MTTDQYNEKALLDYRCELEAMLIENKQREYAGKAPAYGEDAFRSLQDNYNSILNRC